MLFTHYEFDNFFYRQNIKANITFKLKKRYGLQPR